MTKRKIRNTFFALAALLCTIFFLTGFNNVENNFWISSWNTSETNFINMKNNGLFNYENQTLRTIVTLSYGGSQERVKFTNEYGTEELEINAATIALVNSDGVLEEDTLTEIRFNGDKHVVLEEGEYIWSDPVNLEVNPQDKVAVSMYISDELSGLTGGCGNVQAFVSESGDHTLDISNENYEEINISDYPNVSLFMTSIQVYAPEEAGSIVIFGDSISTFSWPEYLTSELLENNIDNLSVVRETIVGNRILHDTVDYLHGLFGPSGISRFEDAITRHSRTEYVIVLEGINDIMSTGPGGTSPSSEIVDADDVIEGLETYIDIAHKHNLKIYGGTIMPFEGYISYTEEEEAVRQEVNQWIREEAQFDAVFDFDVATRDPNNIKRLLPLYDSGDHVHPSEAGSQAMVNAVDVDLFE